LNFFRKNKDQKKKAQGRQLKRLQKFLEKAAKDGMADVQKEMKSLVAEFNDLLAQTEAILPELDIEITDKKDQGEDTTSLEQAREEILQGIEEMRKALAAVPAAPFSAPGPVKQA
jgi:flagellar hook-associated protein FlgK